MSDTQVSVCVGTGRCGTTFITQLAALEPDVAASHERLRLPACFHMFCKWHDIPIDPEGFLADRDEVVAADLAEHRVSFESSALLSHSLLELHERYDARVLLLTRRPDETVASFAARGWFLDPIAWKDRTRPPTIREANNPRHFFGRNLPRGEAAFARWNALTQVGKLGWFWNARIGNILEQFRQLPPTHRHIARLEDFDFAGYQGIAEFLGWTPTIDAEQFARIAGSRPNAGPNAPIAPTEWSARARAEFEAEVGALAQALGYEHRVDRLLAGAAPILGPITVDEVLARWP